ncbi:flagellar basal body protein FliL [Gemmobacter lanyuensis]|uniref:Flagellar protein FliL n=1 Tax=Gemmobacter lanyuensis TaxID=1054497 RepID=A0A918ILE9_9RHOB|nr:flagellar basal body-associated FliL family protein [Gemmobacter lanyuensis]GGW21445.1 flagellar basal body protein FliL [Gemmobacter lanyuensis]
MTKETKEDKPKGGLVGKLLKGLIFLLAVAVFVGVGFGAGYIYFANPMSPAKDVLRLMEKQAEPAAAEEHAAEEVDPNQPQKVPRETPEEEAYVTSYFTFKDPLTSNIKDSRRFLQLGVGLSTEYDAKVFERVQTHELALKSEILKVVTNFTEEELKTGEGRDKLALQIRDALNKKLEELEDFGGIKDVFFPSFVMQ